MAHAAQSIRGRPLEGDALYIRDFGQRVVGSEADRVSDYKLAKTAMLFAMFDLPVEGVELLQRFRDRLQTLFDVNQAIELLTAQAQQLEWTNWTDAEYMKASKDGDPFFFNRLQAPEYDPKTRTGAHPTTLAQDFARREQALANQAMVEVGRLQAEVAGLDAELKALNASRVLRLAAAIRRLIGRP